MLLVPLVELRRRGLPARRWAGLAAAAAVCLLAGWLLGRARLSARNVCRPGAG